MQFSTNSIKKNIRKFIRRRHDWAIAIYITKFIRRRHNWAIGIYTGESPYNLVPDPSLNNPVLTAKDVTDVRADFVADPFMLHEHDTWYMFFEIWNLDTKRGEIALATSKDARHWDYQQVVIDEPFHLSYPYVFKWNDEYYLIPESERANSVRLYKATIFPTQWSFVKTLIEGSHFTDPSVFYYNNMWWLLVSSRENDNLWLYYTGNLMDDWIEHPQSPVVQDNPKIARSAGRVTIFDDKIIRYTQDCDVGYGYQVRAFAITKLTTTSYEEKQIRETPIVTASGSGWNKRGMHQIDPHQINGETWIACVDGYRMQLVIGGKVISL